FIWLTAAHSPSRIGILCRSPPVEGPLSFIGRTNSSAWWTCCWSPYWNSNHRQIQEAGCNWVVPSRTLRSLPLPLVFLDCRCSAPTKRNSQAVEHLTPSATPVIADTPNHQRGSDTSLRLQRFGPQPTLWVSPRPADGPFRYSVHMSDNKPVQ